MIFLAFLTVSAIAITGLAAAAAIEGRGSLIKRRWRF